MRYALLPSLVVAIALLLWWCAPADVAAPDAAASAPGSGPGAAARASATPADVPVAAPAPPAAVRAEAERAPGAQRVALAPFRARVVDGDEQPIEGALVRALGDPAGVALATDRDGVCTLPAPPTEAAHLRVEAGIRHYQAHWQRLPDLTIRMPWYGPVHGRLVDAATHTAIAGAEVVRHHDYCKGCEPDRAVTDERGAFVLPAVPRGHDVSFSFAVRGYPRQWERLKLPGKGEAVEHTFALRRGVAVAGRIVDLASRRPIGGAVLAADGDTVATTGDDGAFAVLLLPEARGRVSFEVRARGWCRVTFVRRDAQPDPATEYPLPRTATVRGRVQTPGGAAIASARVSATMLEQADLPGMPSGALVDDEDHHLSTRTGADGAFALGGLAPRAKHTVRAGHEDHRAPPGARFGVEVVPGDDAPPIVLVLEPRPAISGKGAIVGTYRCNGTAGLGTVTWSANDRAGRGAVAADGTFRLEGVPAGRAKVTVAPRRFEHVYGAAADALHWSGEVDVVADGEVRLDVEQALDEATIAGRVTFADSAPAANVAVRGNHDGASVAARTAADGSYTLRVPAALREWTVHAGNESRKAAPGATGVDLVVARSGVLRLAVRDEAGLPVRAGIHLRSPGAKWFAPQWTDAPDPDGYVEVTVAHGENALLLIAPGLAPVMRAVVASDRSTLDVRMPRGVAVTLRLPADAPPLPERARVAFVDEAFGALDPAAMGIHGLEGRRDLDLRDVVVPAVAPGTHRLTIGDPRLELVPDTVVVGTEPVTVELRWRRRPQ
jgi:hypothetical protein